MCNTSRLDRAGGETKEGWVIDRWLGDYKMAYTTPAPHHQCSPIIHLCFGIFVSKEIPRQQIGNQSFGQSLPLEVNVCPLHAARSCNHSIFFALPHKKWHFKISKHSSRRNPARVFQFVIFVWFSALPILFPSKSPGPGRDQSWGRCKGRRQLQ